jgi:hypothetical protein
MRGGDRKINSVSIYTIFFLIFLPTSCFSQDFSFNISPRFWYFLDSFSTGNMKTGGGTTFLETSEPFNIPMFGASISAVMPALPTTSFTLTALYGTASNDIFAYGGAIVSPDTVKFETQNVDADLRRLDVELTAQTPITESIGWLAGVRYERVRIDFVSNFNQTFGGPGGVSIAPPFSIPFEDGYDLYSIRGGIAGAAPITANRQHRFYGTFMGFAGYRNPVIDTPNRYDSAYFAGPDISVGYQWSVNELTAVDLRYRMIAFFPLTGAGSLSEPKLTHGPSLTVSFTF